MDRGKVQGISEISEISARLQSEKAGNKKKKKQWGIQFLELLEEEFTEEEAREKEEKKEQGQTCGILVQTAERTVVAKRDAPVRMKRDTLELSGDRADGLLTSELYADIIDDVKCVGNWSANLLYKIAHTVMREYGAGTFGEWEVGELFRGCYQKCVEDEEHLDRTEILCRVYEYFCRVSARRCVADNEREGRCLVEGCGLGWAGSTYYNSKYYFSYEKMQWMFARLCRRIAREEGIGEIPFAKVERQTEFGRAGGITYHGVFVWIQQKDNHPAGQYGMRDLEKEPPEQFVYLYRNHFEAAEEGKIQFLEKRMQEETKWDGSGLWRSFTLGGGRDYRNGMSYLLEGSLMEEEEETYGMAMGFLQNFRLYRILGCVEYLSVHQQPELS